MDAEELDVLRHMPAAGLSDVGREGRAASAADLWQVHKREVPLREVEAVPVQQQGAALAQPGATFNGTIGPRPVSSA